MKDVILGYRFVSFLILGTLKARIEKFILMPGMDLRSIHILL